MRCPSIFSRKANTKTSAGRHLQRNRFRRLRMNMALNWMRNSQGSTGSKFVQLDMRTRSKERRSKAALYTSPDLREEQKEHFRKRLKACRCAFAESDACTLSPR